MKIKSTFFCFIAILTFLPLGYFSQASYYSESYTMQETTLKALTISNPIISNVSSSTSGQTATITWTTDVASDSIVIFSTSSDLSNQQEQGSQEQIYTNHSVTLSGLEYGTTYYYKVKSETESGSLSYSDIYAFSTEASSTDDDDSGSGSSGSSSSGGGSILYIKDSVAPFISNIRLSDLKTNSVSIKWETNEAASSFVEYGEGSQLTENEGQWDSSLEHEVILNGLSAGTVYIFSVSSSDKSNNLTTSDYYNFQTLSDEEAVDNEGISTENSSEQETTTNEEALEVDNSDLEESNTEAIEDENSENTDIANTTEDVNTSEQYKTVEDKRDDEIKNDNNYNDNDAKKETVKEPGIDKTEEKINEEKENDEIIPDKAEFVEDIEETKELKIYGRNIEVLDDNSLRFKWMTNKEAKSSIKIINKGDNSETVQDLEDQYLLVHEGVVADLITDSFYDFVLTSEDEDGVLVSDSISDFSISLSSSAPTISNLKYDVTRKDDTAEVIFLWETDRPANSKVYYVEGFIETIDDWDKVKKEVSSVDEYEERHLIKVKNLKVDTNYSFRIESSDYVGNYVLSNIYNFETTIGKFVIFKKILMSIIIFIFSVIVIELIFHFIKKKYKPKKDY